MASERNREGWLSASRMSGQRYMFVEGTSDERFWKKFINRNAIMLTQVNGWENVVSCVRYFNNNEAGDYCFGIVDKDFEEIFTHKSITEDNIFLTDTHDIEIMMYESPAWEAAIIAINKHNRDIPTAAELLREAYSITNRIGYLKISSLKHNLQLLFKHQNKDKVIELPKYEKLLDSKRDYRYKDDDNLIDYLYAYTLNQKIGNLPSKGIIKDRFYEESRIDYPSEQLSNGHDVTYILSYIINNKYLKKQTISLDLVETSLFAAYHYTFLQRTSLYTAMSIWTANNNIDIFLDNQ